MKSISNQTKLLVHLLCLFFVTALYSCKKDVFTGQVGETYRYEESNIGDGISLGSVYFSAKFNAFTDLVYYSNKWYIVFREGSQHVGGTDGVIKVLTSLDGKNWSVEDELSLNSTDLRDPKLVVDSTNNDLYITFFGVKNAKTKNYYVKYQSRRFHSEIQEIDETWLTKQNYCLWRWTYFSKEMYSFAYRISHYNDSTTNLILTRSSTDFTKRHIIQSINLRGQPTESTIRFIDSNRMFVLVRSDQHPAYLGYSEAPYSSFSWAANSSFGRLSSPNFLIYKNKYLLVSGRDTDNQRFMFYVYDITLGKVIRSINLRSGYEAGYGGMCFNETKPFQLWLSYYSIENGGSGSNIYLAKIELDKIIK